MQASEVKPFSREEVSELSTRLRSALGMEFLHNRKAYMLAPPASCHDIHKMLMYTRSPPEAWFAKTKALVADILDVDEAAKAALMEGSWTSGQAAHEREEYLKIERVAREYEEKTGGLRLTRTGPVKTLIVMGIETDMCVLTTVVQAVEAGYRVIVVSDAVGAGQ